MSIIAIKIAWNTEHNAKHISLFSFFFVFLESFYQNIISNI